MAANNKNLPTVAQPLDAFAEVGEAMLEAVIATDEQGRITAMNVAAEQLTGWDRGEALGQRHDRLLRLVDGQGRVPDSPVLRCLREQQVIRLDDWQEQELTARDGRRQNVRLRCTPVHTGVHRVLLALQDFSQQSLLSRELDFRMSHDPVTGLINREALDRRLAEGLTQARDHGAHHLYCHLDIDQFKVINDSLGFGAGDDFLREIAGHLRARLMPGDALARTGGDEFGALLRNCKRSSGAARVEALLVAARSLRFSWGQRKHAATVSIGVIEVDAQTAGVADILSLGEAACRAAKSAGRDRAHFIGGGDEISRRRKSEMDMVARVRHALDHDRFVLHAEDVVKVASPKEVVYRELLVRMRDRGNTLLRPDRFIPAAERYSMIGALDRWIIRAALAELARRQDDGVVHAINLSGMSLSDDQLLQYIEDQLSASGVDPRRICFEITETAAISSLAEAVRLIERLKDLGCRFALDDFGAGMASFSYLKSLPVDFLKIDGSFVTGMSKNRVNQGMVEAVHRVGHEMGLKTIAEHVEDAAVLKLLHGVGVDYAQGRAIGLAQPFTGIGEDA